MFFREWIELIALVPTDRQRVVEPEHLRHVPEVMVWFLFRRDSSQPRRADSISPVRHNVAIDYDHGARNLVAAGTDNDPIKVLDLIGRDRSKGSP